MDDVEASKENHDKVSSQKVITVHENGEPVERSIQYIEKLGE